MFNKTQKHQWGLTVKLAVPIHSKDLQYRLRSAGFCRPVTFFHIRHSKPFILWTSCTKGPPQTDAVHFKTLSSLEWHLIKLLFFFYWNYCNCKSPLIRKGCLHNFDHIVLVWVSWRWVVSKSHQPAVTRVPQGSLPGPLLFPIYTASLGFIIQVHSSNNTELYFLFQADNTTVAELTSACLVDNLA